MSRQEADREDLFAEIRALSPRVEFEVSPDGPIVTAGFRAATGGWSVYFGADPTYHFDSSGGLRRAYAKGLLYRTQGATLARLDRQRTSEEVQLLRSDLTEAELAEFIDEMRNRLKAFCESIRLGEARVLRQEPPEKKTAEILSEALGQILAADPILAPAIPTRRH
jgi:hypothetical protein